MCAEKKYFTVCSAWLVHTTCHTACALPVIVTLLTFIVVCPSSHCHSPHLHCSVSIFTVIAFLIVAAFTAVIPGSHIHYYHQTHPLCSVDGTFEPLLQLLLLGSLLCHYDPLTKETDAGLLGSWQP